MTQQQQPYPADVQKLIDDVNARHEAQSGKSRLWGWFGLSYASSTMSDAIPVHCRHCDEPLDVYQPLEDRFCCQDCKDAYENGSECDSFHGYFAETID